MTPWQHYVIDGQRKGYNNGNLPPDTVFFREGYELEYPDVMASGEDAWHHYVENGLKEGRDNGLHPNDQMFFAAGYLEMYPDVADCGIDPWRHYVLQGKKEGRDNGLHPGEHLFFSDGYLTMYPDVTESGLDPWRHYVMQGKKEGRDNGLHPGENLFFADGYLTLYSDVLDCGIDAWKHYVLHGKKEGRDNGLHPTDDKFFADGYIEMYPELAGSVRDAWKHYVLHGKKDGRDNGRHPPENKFFADGYKCNYPCCINERYGSDLWMNYIKIGKPKKRNNGLLPEEPFFYGAYLERHPNSNVAEAWRYYVLNSSKETDNYFDLYPAESGLPEILGKKNPSVAVIMPVYNRKDIIMKAISSIQNQSWANWHLYIVDDYSDDGTYEYLRSVISDPRIILLKSKYKGVCGARNTAIEHIKEDYVAYLDSDNTWNREYLELMLCRLLETNTYCCYGVLKRFRKETDGSIKILDYLYQPFDIYRLQEFNYIDINVFMHSSCVFKTAGVFDISLRRMVDWDLILSCAEKYSFSRLPYVGCNYDHTQDATRITQDNSFTRCYLNVIRNKHWLDWKFLSKNSEYNDKSLVSVIVYYGRNDSVSFLRDSLNSLKDSRQRGNSKYRIEIILVDDSCAGELCATVPEFYDKSMIDRYLVNKTECGLPLSCNRALCLAQGGYTVFLNSKAYVSVDWLDSLIKPLTIHKKLMGAMSKIVQPNGALTSTGCLFDSVSGFPYNFLRGVPAFVPASNCISLFPSVNSYCCAFRTCDVIERKGLNCIYESGVTFADLCLQLANGESRFAYIPQSQVICPTAELDSSIQSNDLEAFAERWYGKSIYSEHKFFARKHLCELSKQSKKVCSVTFKKYTQTACSSHSTEFLIPVYQYLKFDTGVISRKDQGSRIKDQGLKD